MKLLFFSSDESELELAITACAEASIPCETRSAPLSEDGSLSSLQTEFWIHNDEDAHRALLLCVGLGIGFSKRPVKAVLLEA